MALGKQLPIRLDTDTERRLESAAQKAGTTKSAIIRLLAQSFVDQVVRAGQVVLPPNWGDLLPRADDRAAKARRDPAHRDAVRLNCALNETPGEASAPLPPRREVSYTSAKKSTRKKRKP